MSDTKARAKALLAKHQGLLVGARGGVCQVERSGERELVEELLKTETQAAVLRMLKLEGITIAYNSLGRHYRKECRCQREPKR